MEKEMMEMMGDMMGADMMGFMAGAGAMPSQSKKQKQKQKAKKKKGRAFNDDFDSDEYGEEEAAMMEEMML